MDYLLEHLLKCDIGFELKKFKNKGSINTNQFNMIMSAISDIHDINKLVAIKFNLNNILETSIILNDLRVFNSAYEFADFLCFDELDKLIKIYYLLNSLKTDYIASNDIAKYGKVKNMLFTVNKLLYDISCDNVSYDIQPIKEAVNYLNNYNSNDIYLRHFKALNIR